jgi:hypothetical protein
LNDAVMASPEANPPEKFIGLLKRFQSSDLIAERHDAGKSLCLEKDQYAVSKALATKGGKYSWTSIYFQNEAAPALVTAGFVFYRRHWVYVVLGSGAGGGFAGKLLLAEAIAHDPALQTRAGDGERRRGEARG